MTTYAAAVAKATGEAIPQVVSEVKVLEGTNGCRYPVVFCPARENRPYQNYATYTNDNCPLCRRVHAGDTHGDLVAGLQWLPATYPIKSLHGICYPAEHRAAILAEDIAAFGRFAEAVPDVVIGINLRGSAASLPEHFHGQLHDRSFASRPEVEAFPLLTRPLEPIATTNGLAISRLLGYPACAVVVEGEWARVAAWLRGYMAASNIRPHNFALLGGGRLIAIPRGLERAPSQQNRYGASEMLGMISPVTRDAFDAINSAATIEEALADCSLRDATDRVAVEEHAVSVAETIPV